MMYCFVKRLILGLIVVATVGLTTSCTQRPAETASAPKNGQIRAVSTTGMINDVVKNVGGSHVHTTGLMGPGVDPHLYRASEGDVRTLSNANVIFYNGLHLEAKLGDVLEKMNRRVPTIAVTQSVPKTDLLNSDDYEGLPDPHVWFDVSKWVHAAYAVRDGLIKVDPKNATTYRQNADNYVAELNKLDAWIKKEVADIPASNRVLVTAHDAFGYFGKAYAFKVVGLQGISTESKAGTKDVQKLADYISTNKIPAIFVESSVSQRSIQAVQEAVKARGWNVKIGGELFSDAMGSEGTAEGTYIGMVRHNINTIANALNPKRIAKGTHK